MKKSTLILLLLSSLFTFSQSPFNSESFRVTLNDIKNNSFEKDSTANALVIYEYGNSYVHKGDYDLRTEKKFKVKLLNREGFDNATITIHLYKDKNSKERVKNILATTYNLIDGEVVKTKLQEKDIFTEVYDENHTLVKFTLPNIKAGSIITYSYTIISPFMFKYHGWEFQGDIPKLYSEYRTSIPGNWVYHVKLVGGKKLAVNESELEKECLQMYSGATADCGNSVYAMKDIPAFIEEDYMTTKSNYLARIEYELETFRGMDGTIKHYTKTWDAVDKELKNDKEIGKQLKKSIEIQDLLTPEIINEPNPLKRAQAIYRYVQDHYVWNKEYRVFTEVSIKDILKNKSGNVSSINILLHNLLKTAGIDVNPVLISTRENGFPTTIYPVLSDFNYQIVQATINDTTYLLDATEDFLSFGEIPFRCLNGLGRVIDFKNGSEWLNIEPKTVSKMFYQAELEINEAGLLFGNINSKRTGYHAQNAKRAYLKSNTGYLDKLENEYSNIDISDFQVTNQGEERAEFEESYNVEYDYHDVTGNILLNPFMIQFFNKNPFKLQNRTYPIDFGYKDSYYYILKFKINENYTVTETPKDLRLILPNQAGDVTFSTKLVGNSLNLMLRINFKRAIYAPEYYPYLKEFFSEIVDIQTNSLILLKKDG